MSFTVNGVVLTCANTSCGISFQVPEWWHRGKRETHTTFYCPNGHSQSFTAESDLDKARRERDIARQQIARAEEETAEANRRAIRIEKEKRRLEKRVSAGTCPCCQRTFSNMSTHMRKQHPQFVAEQTTNVVPIKKKA